MHKKGNRTTGNGLRIIRGALGGRVIHFVDRPDLRPTMARVREAVFSILDPFRDEFGFVDLCAGSGAMGFEAYSSGFRPVLMLDTDPVIMRSLKENADHLGAEVILIKSPASALANLLPHPGSYVVYSDPPYRDQNFHPRILDLLARTDAIASGSLYIAEQESWDFQALDGTSFSLFKRKRYGRTHLFFLIKN